MKTAIGWRICPKIAKYKEIKLETKDETIDCFLNIFEKTNTINKKENWIIQ